MPSAMMPIDPSIPLSPTALPPTTSPSNAIRRASLKVLSRNINKVVLGHVLFRTWYYSPYPDSIILGDDYLSNTSTTSNTTKPHPHSTIKAEAFETITGQPLTNVACERLHVCPYCFRYTPKEIAYVQHLRRHKVTYNPHSRKPESADTNSRDSPSSESSEDTSTWPVPQTAIKVYENAGYTVWDIDGEREKLYCQNLSLFGKLFLEQKSVFFDTGGFHYFVLTYTPPAPSPNTTPKKATVPNRPAGRRRSSGAAPRPNALANEPIPIPEDINLNTQVLGFFSKENLSWDSNNLACILVFPPYQHRNLGQLLMAVSYKLSGWEWEDSIIGGPEKPLSAMGRKSYLRFWSERVARFMMGQTADADGRRIFDTAKKRKKNSFNKEEMTVKDLGDRTGMLPEDVVAALNEMGVLEAVPVKKKKRKSEETEAGAEMEEQVFSSMIVHRSKVLEWAEGKKVDMVNPVREEGFLGEWAMSEIEDGEDEDEEVDESE